MVRQIGIQARNKIIEVLGNEPISGQQFYSDLIDYFENKPEIPPFPVEMIYADRFRLTNGWNFGSLRSKMLIKDASWEVIDEKGWVTERWLELWLAGDVREDDRYWFNDGLWWKAFRKPYNIIPNLNVRCGGLGWIHQTVEIRSGTAKIEILGLRGKDKAFTTMDTECCGYDGKTELPTARMVFPIVFDRLGDEEKL
jgi:hypothetical protein